MPEIKLPNPDHPITLTPDPRRLRVIFNGQVVAESDAVISLREATYPAVAYFPREAADLAAYVRTDRSTHCPYKGEASYFSLSAGAQVADNAVWTYEAPYPAMEAIRGRLAFYPNKVEIVAV